MPTKPKSTDRLSDRPAILAALQQLGREIGGEFTPTRKLNGGLVESHGNVLTELGPWSIATCIFTNHQKGEHTWTQIYTPYRTRAKFTCSIQRAGLILHLAAMLRIVRQIKDISPALDRHFLVRGNDPHRVRALLSDPSLVKRIEAQPQFALSIKDNPWPPNVRSPLYFPPDVDILVLQMPGAVADAHRLKAAYKAFVATLEGLSRIGVALREAPDIKPWGPFGTSIPTLPRPTIHR